MGKKEKVRLFSCLECGTPFEAYPPDDRHTIATRNEKDYEDHIKVEYRCKGKGCDYINVIYWGHSPPAFIMV